VSFDGLLNRLVTVTRRSPVADGQGGSSAPYVTTETLRGRIRPVSTREAIIGARPETDVSHVAYFRPVADIRARDRLVADGRTYEVIGVRRPSDPRHIEVDCRERQRGA